MGKLAFAVLIGSLAGVAPLTAQAPAAAANRPAMIFFGWGGPEIDRDAAAILDEITANFATAPGATLSIDGHSDRSGPAGPNRRTALKRAEAVRDYLAARGIPAGAMTVAGHGEDQPIIATADGVREPQNRRVEIRFGPGAGDAAMDAAPRKFALTGGDGAALGDVAVSDGPGGVVLTIRASGMAPGVHGLHLHETGRCEGPKFASAGKHWNPNARQHGRDNPAGAHRGDLPNLIVTADGTATASFPLDGVMMASGAAMLADADGTALVVHAKADDYKTDPSGDSGDRVACAVVAAVR